jgi:hypothetical protein
MHSALFVTTNRGETKDWVGFTDVIDAKVKPGEGIMRLAENVWLVSVRDQVSAFASLVSVSERFGVAYAILPFEHEPEWLPGGFDPTTIWGRKVGT